MTIANRSKAAIRAPAGSKLSAPPAKTLEFTSKTDFFRRELLPRGEHSRYPSSHRRLEYISTMRACVHREGSPRDTLGGSAV